MSSNPELRTNPSAAAGNRGFSSPVQHSRCESAGLVCGRRSHRKNEQTAVFLTLRVGCCWSNRCGTKELFLRAGRWLA